MAEKTSRMISVLGAMRKQMNGAVADSMFYYGRKYGLNYGVSLPTIRSIAQTEECDHELAVYLFQQQVRELQLAALHIADAEKMSSQDDELWHDGVINSEIAEEMAFALLARSPHLKEIFIKWSASDNEYAVYAAQMAAARTPLAAEEASVAAISAITVRYPDSRIIAQGSVALLAAAFNHEQMREVVKQQVASLTKNATTDYIVDEMSWRMEL